MFLTDFEIILLLTGVLIFAGFYVWLMLNSRKTRKQTRKNKIKQKVAKEKITKPKTAIIESYDYLGTKIYHNDGKYTVVEDNISRNFSSLESLPVKYRKMILEMQSQSFSGKRNHYYMEQQNGIYIIVFPDGSKKKFKNYKDIPDNLKKMLKG